MKSSANIYKLLALLISSLSIAQAPDLQWQKTFGGSLYDSGMGIIPTSDGNFIIIGNSESSDGDSPNNYGGGDIWLVKILPNGELYGDVTRGGSQYDAASAIIETADNGLLIAGESMSNDFAANKGGLDAILLKLDENGGADWVQNYGGSGDDAAVDLIETEDGGILFVGFTDSEDGDLNQNYGRLDVWVVKINAQGIVQWSQTYGGSENDTPKAVIQNSDGNYLIAGQTFSDNNHITENKGNGDIWLLEISPTGTLLWQKTFGGSNVEDAFDLKQTTNGGYLIAGTTASQDGDVSDGNGGSDAWILRLDANKELSWEKNYGGSESDEFRGIQLFADDSFVAYGNSRSSNGDLTENKGDFDFWVMKADADGELIWQKSMGGSDRDYGRGLAVAEDGSYKIVGYTLSDDGDIDLNKGDYDLWVLSLAADPLSLDELDEVYLKVFPNPVSDFVHIQSKFPLQHISIHNLTGKRVKNEFSEKNSIELNISDLPAGTYVLSIETEGKIYKQKLLKK